jgi:hypothetical protein
VRPNAKENGQIRPSNAIPDAWKAGSRPYLEVGLPTSSRTRILLLKTDAAGERPEGHGRRRYLRAWS